MDKKQTDIEEYIKKFQEETRHVKIIRNSAKCLKCGDEIRSASRHDFNSCSCGSLSVDGGTDYLRRCGNPEDYEDTSICKEVIEDSLPSKSIGRA